MNQRNCIAGFLLILFALCSHVNNSRHSGVHKNVPGSPAGTLAKSSVSKESLDLKKTVIKNDWIKVRYTGGECGYDSPGLVIKFTIAAFVNHRYEAKYISFFASQYHILFKLRGPPSITV